MAGFNAGKAVEALDYDFTTLVNPRSKKPYLDRKGTIPEPSDLMIGDYMAALQKLAEDMRKSGLGEAAELATGDEDVTGEQIIDALAGVETSKEFTAMHARMAELVSGLIGGELSPAELLKVPMRGRAAFYAWLQDEVVNPEAETAAGNGQVVRLPVAARG